MRVLIGVMDSNIGGVNRYIADYISNKSQNTYIILSSGQLHDVYRNEIKGSSHVEIIPSVMHPQKLYNCVKKIIKKYKIDSLYLNISTNLFYPALKAAFDCGVSERIVHSHSSYSADVSFLKRITIVFINKILRKKINKITTVRKACSDKAAIWLFGKHYEYEFIYNKVNGKRFTFDIEKRKQLRKDFALENIFVIGFVGGFNYPKNVFYFLKIANKLKKNRNDFCIVMLGDGELRTIFIRKLKKLNLEKYFVLLGSKPNVNEYYNMFDCFLMPSRFEGLPIVGVEAQVNGIKSFFSNKITQSVKITEECEFFQLSNFKNLIQSLRTMKIRHNEKLTLLDNYNNFIHTDI